MKNLFLLAILLPLLLGGCGEKSVSGFEHEGVNQKALELRKGVNYLKYSDIPYTGKSFKLYDNGEKKMEANLKGGKLDGLHVMWYENGQKQWEGNWKDGKIVLGSRKRWDKKGELTSREEAQK